MHRYLSLLLLLGCSSEDKDSTRDTDSSDAGATQGFVFATLGFAYAPLTGPVDGLDLDGTTSSSDPSETCPHDDFEGGVDFNMLRVIEQVGEGLGQGQIVDGILQSAVGTGSITLVVEVSGIDDPVEDDSVMVQLFASEDAPPTGSAGTVIGGGSLAVHPDDAFHGTPVSGRIEGGVLQAGPFELTIPFNIQLVTADLVLRTAHLRLDIDPDSGGGTGLLGAYWPIGDVISILGEPTQEFGPNPDDESLPGAAGFALADLRSSLETHADGGSACDTISTVFAFDAAQAFVIR